MSVARFSVNQVVLVNLLFILFMATVAWLTFSKAWTAIQASPSRPAVTDEAGSSSNGANGSP